jgi:hypothetical protein
MQPPKEPQRAIEASDIPRSANGATVEKYVVPPESPFSATATDIIDSTRNYNQKQLDTWVLPDKMKALLAEIEADTQANNYVRREESAEHPGMISETLIDFDSLIMQEIDYAISDSDPVNTDPVNKKWDTHLTRQSGLRGTVASLLQNNKTRGAFVAAVRQRQAEIIQARDGVEAESRLTPEQYEKAALDEGEVAVKSTPVLLDMGVATRAAQAMVSGNEGVAEASAVTPEVATETDLQMNERFLRETEAELRDLYAELRKVAPGSWEAGQLQNQIKHAKEDTGKFAKKIANLKGQNWT